MTGMTMTAESVAAASNAWVWVPDNATVVEDEQYKIARLPDYFDYQLSVLQFQPSRPLGERGRRGARPGARVRAAKGALGGAARQPGRSAAELRRAAGRP